MASAEHKKKLENKHYHLDPDKFPDQQPEKGCTTKCHRGKAFGPTKKHGDYRANGYETIKGQADKSKTYNATITFGQKEKLPLQRRIGIGGKAVPVADVKANPKAWCIGNGAPADNFKCAYKPYNHAYHHIMPVGALHKGLSIKVCLALMNVGYNVNDGINLIILPRDGKIGALVGLYYHATNHSKYSKSITDILKTMDASLKEAFKACDSNKINGISKRLEQWEKAMFKVLKTCSGNIDVNQSPIKPIAKKGRK